MKSPSETTSTRSPSMSAMPAGRSGDAAVPRLPSQARSVSGADAKPSRAASSVSRTSRRPKGRRGRKRSRARAAAIASSSETATRPRAVMITAHVAPGADQAQRQTGHERDDPEDPGDPEARNDEDLEGQEDQTGAHEQQLLPAGQPHQPVAPEEEREAADADTPGTPKPGVRISTMIPSMPTVISSELTTGWVRKRTTRLRPGRRRPPHLGAGRDPSRSSTTSMVSARKSASLCLQRLRRS